MDEKIHVFIRNKKNGRIVTHFLEDVKIWDQYEALARLEGLTMSEFVDKAIREALENVGVQETAT